MTAMRGAFLLSMVSLLLSVSVAGQEQVKTPRIDLSRFSSQQLVACYADASICGSKSEYREIEDELANRLPKLPSEQLVACFEDWKMCGVAEDQSSGWAISDELARRGNPHKFLERYWTEHKPSVRDGIEHIAYHFKSDEVTEFMRKVLNERKDDGEDLYWPVNYLAKKCDPAALKELSSGRYRNQGSLQYQTSVQLFGKCQYRQAIPYLVDYALHDFSGNIIGAAQDSLQELYPQSPKEFQSIEDMRKYFCGRARKEGFNMKCKSK